MISFNRFISLCQVTITTFTLISIFLTLTNIKNTYFRDNNLRTLIYFSIDPKLLP